MKDRFIVATISDINCDVNYLEQLAYAGVKIFRLNTAHQSFDGSRKVINNIREVIKKTGLDLKIMVDTKGPEIRTYGIDETIQVREGEILEIAIDKSKLGAKGFCVSYKNIINYAKLNDIVLIDDGEVELVIKDKTADTLMCEVINTGIIENKKSVNVPGMKVDLPSLTDRDKEYIKFTVNEGADYIAHSFVRSKQDIDDIRKVFTETGASKLPKIYAKIENLEGVNNIDEIIDNVYGVLVARGDLANEIPLEDLPYAQKLLIKKSNKADKPVIVATQMIYSMCSHPRPTRAEITDIANAILDGATAVMLSGETTHGKYPVLAVKTMQKIVNRYKHGLDYNYNDSKKSDFVNYSAEQRI